MSRLKILVGLLLSLPLALAGIAAAPEPVTASPAATGVGTAADRDGAFRPSADQHQTARVMQGLLSASRHAYRPKPLDDALSEQIFDRYLEALDPQRLFFTTADIEALRPLRGRLDDAIRDADLQPVFDLYLLYMQRVEQRIAAARARLERPFDFDTDKVWYFDREDAPWAADAAALDALWEKSIKNDWLRLRLAGREDPEIRRTLDRRYAQIVTRVAQLKPEDAFETFMNAYAGSIDPHTSYLSPRSAENFNLALRLSLEGIGAVLQNQEDFVVIRTLVPGGPAARSGQLGLGDRIVAVGQEDGAMVDVVGWRIDDVVQRIRGPKGSTVRLDVIPAALGPDGAQRRVEIVRDRVRLEEQAARRQVVEADGRRIGLIRLPTFYLDFEAKRRGDPDARSATRDVARLLGELEAEGVDGVVIDLRGNGGGSLTEAIELTGLFIDSGPVVQVREAGGRVSVEADEDPGVAWNGPLAVLIDRSSASASEIFAAAIQDYGRGLVLGETSFGKGTVQNLESLDRVLGSREPRFGHVKLTIAQFYRIEGDTTQFNGVVPDLVFPVTLDATLFGESTFDNALPATRIEPVRHVDYGDFAPLLLPLAQRHQTRLTADRELYWWAQDVAEFRADRARGSLSLNEARRRAERAEDEARRQARQLERVQLGLVDGLPDRADDGLQSDERDVAQQVADEQALEQHVDPLLQESARVLADAITLLERDAALASRVLPKTGQAGIWVE